MKVRAADRGVSIEEMVTLFLQENCPSTIIERFARLEEIAALCVYTAFPQACAMTGAALRVDGGIVEGIS